MEIKARASQLKLGDTIRHSPLGIWNTAIVKQISENEVTLFRPYGTTADFSFTGGVICYVGIELYTVSLTSDFEYDVLSRKELK